MTEDELRQLQELAYQLEELTAHPGWSVLIDYVHNGAGMLGAHQRYLLAGSCKSPEEYQKYAGWVHGSLAVLEAPVNVRKLADKYSVQAGAMAVSE